MGKLHPIPDAALDSDIAILGRKGGGKTYTSKGIVERLLDLGRRVLVLDPLGVWAGLRTAADGEAPGYPVAIFGGAQADLPLDLVAAEPLARIIATENLPAVIDLSELSKGAQQAFLLAFLHELRRVNTEALTIVLEEADVFAPQNPMGDDSKLLHSEIDWIARRGRFKGFRLITITQRPARLSKDVLTQCATLIAHRLPAPQDRDAVKAWVDGNGDRDKAREVFDTLASLDVGEGWVWAPEHGILDRCRFPRIKTLDTSATPKAGEWRIEPKTLAAVDLSGIREALAAAVPADKKPAGRTGGAGAADIAAALKRGQERGYELGYADGKREGKDFVARTVLAQLESFFDSANAGAAAVAPAQITPRPKPAASREKPNASPQMDSTAGLNSAARKMLAVLDTNPPVRRSWQQVATLAGLKARGGHFNAGRKALIELRLVDETNSLVAIVSPSAAAPTVTSDPAALIEQWAGVLSGAAPRILRHLFHSGGREARLSVAMALGMQPRGGHWNAAWKELRENCIVTVSGDTASLTELFMPPR
jgi:hypothetical protein